MVDEILNTGESVEETTGEHLDPKEEIKSVASENIATSFQDEKADSEESKEVTKEDLLNKPNMTSTDKENMQKSISYLQKNKMDTEKNLKKLDAINYGSNYIEIGGVKFSREKLVPHVKFNEEKNKYGAFESDKKWLYKSIYNGKEEYYLTADAYIAEAKEQWKKAITNDHIRKVLQALPGKDSHDNLYQWEKVFSNIVRTMFDPDDSKYQWKNILWNILNLSTSGYLNYIGASWHKGDYGYLGTSSNMGGFVFGTAKGELLWDNFYRDHAYPCLFVVE